MHQNSHFSTPHPTLGELGGWQPHAQLTAIAEYECLSGADP